MNWFTEQFIEILNRLNQIWWNDIPDDFNHSELIKAANLGQQTRFMTLLKAYEAHHRKKIDDYIQSLREITCKWSALQKELISKRIDELQRQGNTKQRSIQQAYAELNDGSHAPERAGTFRRVPGPEKHEGLGKGQG